VEEGALTLDYEGKPSTDYKPGDSVVVEPGEVHEGINSHYRLSELAGTGETSDVLVLESLSGELLGE
jgi:quercetin dioxygenase-like cupin family protein